MKRRIWLQALAGCLATSSLQHALASTERRDPRAPLKLAVESALLQSGLAAHLAAAVGRDLGLKLELLGGPSLELLNRLEAGAVDATLTQAPQREAELAHQGLIHDLQPVAVGRYVLVGPPKDPAGIKGLKDVKAALAAIAEQGTLTQQQVVTGQPDGCGYVLQGEPDGTQAFEATLWKAVGKADAAPWKRAAPKGVGSALKLAAQWPVGGGYTLVERSVWTAAGKLPLKAWVDDDPQLDAVYSVARSFRVNHPAGKLLVGWLSGPNGRRAVQAFGKGYRPPG